MQISSNSEDGIVIKCSIEWPNDCEYILTYKEVLNHPEDMSIVIGQQIHCTIISNAGKKLDVACVSPWMNDTLTFVKVD